MAILYNEGTKLDGLNGEDESVLDALRNNCKDENGELIVEYDYLMGILKEKGYKSIQENVNENVPLNIGNRA